MFERIVEAYVNECDFSKEEAVRFVETLRRSKTKYRGFLKQMRALNMEGHYLDVGAGPGVLTLEVAKRHPGVRITALEPSPVMVEMGEKMVSKHGLQDRIVYVEGGVEQQTLLESLGKFDLVYSCFSLHHFEDAASAIQNLTCCLERDGVLFIHDLKRVYWLYCLPFQNRFFHSIRASYREHELREMVAALAIKNYLYSSVFPFFLQSLVIT